jgi:hypothetical protein
MKVIDLRVPSSNIAISGSCKACMLRHIANHPWKWALKSILYSQYDSMSAVKA